MSPLICYKIRIRKSLHLTLIFFYASVPAFMIFGSSCPLSSLCILCSMLFSRMAQCAPAPGSGSFSSPLFSYQHTSFAAPPQGRFISDSCSPKFFSLITKNSYAINYTRVIAKIKSKKLKQWKINNSSTDKKCTCRLKQDWHRQVYSRLCSSI